MFYRIPLMLCVAFAVPLLVVGEAEISKPKPLGCDCPKIEANLTEKACGLDWISHARVTSKVSKTVKGTKLIIYQLQHLKVYKGGKTLPKLLIVPAGSCALNLKKKKDYLLSGLKAGTTQLYATRCLSLQDTPTPVWKKVPGSIKKAITKLTCKGLPTLPTVRPTFPTVLPTIPVRK